jgi:ABC-type nitrate/sulfonate/bicarbonate transport system substrate-binding protein
MEFKSIDEQVIQKYQEDEQLMIQLFVQWCVNHELDANELYARAYPEQQENASLQKVLKEMNDSDHLEIDNETMMDVLQLFGNFDLAFVLSEEIERLSKK